MQIVNFIKDRISALISEEHGQDGIEYLLVIGGISVAVIAAALIIATGTPGLVSDVCAAISGVDGAGGLDFTCTAP